MNKRLSSSKGRRSKLCSFSLNRVIGSNLYVYIKGVIQCKQYLRLRNNSMQRTAHDNRIDSCQTATWRIIVEARQKPSVIVARFCRLFSVGVLSLGTLGEQNVKMKRIRYPLKKITYHATIGEALSSIIFFYRATYYGHCAVLLKWTTHPSVRPSVCL